MSYTEDIETFTLKGLKDLASKLGAAQYGNKTDIAARIAAKNMGEAMLQTLFDKCKAEKDAKKDRKPAAKETMVLEDKLPDEFVEEYGMKLLSEGTTAEGKTTFTYVMKKGKRGAPKKEDGDETAKKKPKAAPKPETKPETKPEPKPKKVGKKVLKKEDVVVVDESDQEEEEEEDDNMIPFDGFTERLYQKIGDDRDLVNALIHKYDSVPMSTIKALPKKKAMKALADLMCFEEEEE